MAGFSRHESTTAKRLVAIEERINSWDWRQEAARGATTSADRPGKVPTSRQTPMLQGRNRVWALVAACVVVLGFLGGIVWATTGSQHNGPTAPSQSVAATRFNSADNVARAAGIQLANGFSNLKSLPTVSTVSHFTDSYENALGSYVARLDRITWTSSEVGASRVLKSRVHAFITFLQTIHTISPAGLGAWIKTLYTHVATVTFAAQRLRRDLGLPPTPTT
jgi:hypothetical protein